MNLKPDLSIIILVYNKAYEMGLILEAFSLQTHPTDRFELVIVNDGSEDGLEDEIKEYQSRLQIKHIKNPHTGNRAQNRNSGIDASASDLLLFLDGDMIPERDFVEKHYQAIKDHPKMISMGMRTMMAPFNTTLIDKRTVRDHFDVIRTLPGYLDDGSSYLHARKRLNINAPDPWYMVFSNNLCIWKSFYRDIGGFDANFSKGWGAEDIELGYRAAKAGGEIKINPDIYSYHIYHIDDWIEKYRQLKLNSDYFYRKHQNWEIEIYKYLPVIGVKFIDFYENLKKKEHGISSIQNVDEFLQSLPRNCLNVGIVDPQVLACEKITYHLVSNLLETPSGKNMPTLGSCHDVPDKTYHTALLSYNYLKIDESFFELVVKELDRISENIIIVDEKGPVKSNRLLDFHFIEQSGNSIQYKKIPKVRFIITDSVFNTVNIYYYLQLAYFLKKSGVDVSIAVTGDSDKKADLFTGFFRIGDKEKQSVLKQCLNKEFGYYDSSIPTFMDTYQYGNITRAIGRKFHWTETLYENFANHYKLPEEDVYDFYLSRRKGDMNNFGPDKPTSFLPVGLDVRSIEKIQKENSRSNDGNIKFLWIEPILDEHCGISGLLEIFKALSDNPNIHLTVISSQLHGMQNWQIENLEVYYNQEFIKYIAKYIELEGKKYHDFVNGMLEKSANIPNVKLIMSDYTEEEIFAEIAKADFLIDTHLSHALLPYVLAVAAMGKKTLSPSVDAYSEYLDSEFFIPIKYELESGITFGPMHESIWYTFREERRHYGFKMVDTEYLKVEIERLGMLDKKKWKVSEDKIKVFKDKFDWNCIVKQFKNEVGRFLFEY